MNKAFVASLLAVVFCAPALGDLSSFTPWTDPSTSITWAGTAELKAEKLTVPGTYLWADVEWRVSWDDSADKFHYLYQITNKGDYEISLLGIPMLESNEAQDIGSFLTAGGEVVPGSADFTPGVDPSLASWSFPGLMPGEVSYALDYWSVNKPLALGGYIQDSGIFAVNGAMPSPDNLIPEPATMSLVVLCGVALLRRRR